MSARARASLFASTLTLCSFTADASGQVSPARSLPALSESQRAIHLLSRTTYGVRPSDVDELTRFGSDAWLEVQLHPETIVDSELDAIRQRPVAPTPSSIPLVQSAAMSEMTPPAAIRRMDRGTQALVSGKVLRAACTRRQLEEVMTDFWFNHFNVSLAKSGRGNGVVPHYERTAIRPHVFGRFEEMLLAVAQHPAMLVYLDNYLNTTPSPDSPRGGGINENYARELLELHTLGVDGGYTEQDVTEVARAFTGWSTLTAQMPAPRAPAKALTPVNEGMLWFYPEWHDPGTKVVLGRTLADGGGIEDGREVIALLARHPSTARHIATKLARHFVADEPPAELVDALTRVFLETDGDLREVTRALFTSEAFFRPEHYRAKVKRPFELVASTLRLINGRPVSTEVAFLLEDLLHLPYNEPAPTGYPTTADEWMGAGAVISRANFGLEVAAGRYLEAPIDPWAFLGLADGSADMLKPANAAGGARYDARAITRRLLGRLLVGAPTAALEEATVRQLERVDSSNPQALVAGALGLLLGSPEFQRH